ncbi:hypothetical protein D3P09_10910 [Paenibacillus pinisoli]|uniref:Uncharacterized protein n=1 Tax=Paenibacillus pinisoli TaxID=1276110 RepID=A0A3A6PE36_9BACL|nr:hypothetical protein D3P09_10910 [Paenibacillus pinisoli]
MKEIQTDTNREPLGSLFVVVLKLGLRNEKGNCIGEMYTHNPFLKAILTLPSQLCTIKGITSYMALIKDKISFTGCPEREAIAESFFCHGREITAL